MPTQTNQALRSILILSPICVHVFQFVTFLRAFPHKPCIFIFPIRATYPFHYILFFFIPQIISKDKYKWRSSSLRDFLRPPITSSLLGPSFFLSTLFSNTPLRNVGNQVSHHTFIHTYIQRHVIVLCLQSLYFSAAIFFWGGRGSWVGGNSALQFSRHSPNFIDPLLLHVRKLFSLISFPNAWIISQSQRICLPFLCCSLVSHYVHEKLTFLVFLSICFWINHSTRNQKNPVFLCIVFQHLSTEVTSKQQPQSSRSSLATHVLSQSHSDLHVYDFVLLLQG